MITLRERLFRTLLDDIAKGLHCGKFHSARRIVRLWPVSRPTVEAALKLLIERGILQPIGERSLGVTPTAEEVARRLLHTPAIRRCKPLTPRTGKTSFSAVGSSLDLHSQRQPADDKAPLYEHLIKTLLIELASGAHPEQQRFLSRHKICRMWQVSGPTAISAIRYLRGHKLIEKVNPRLHRIAPGAIQKARLMLVQNPLPPLPTRADWLRKRALLLKGTRTEGCRLAAILDEPRIYWDSIGTLPATWTLNDSRTQINSQWYVFSFMQEAHRHFSSVSFLLDDGTPEANRRIQQTISSEGFDGIAVFRRKREFPRKPLLAALKRFGIPVITVFDNCEGEADLSVDFNEAAGGYDAMQRLLQAGHRSILILYRSKSHANESQRLTGVLACVRDLGLEDEVHLHHLDFSIGRPQRKLAHLLSGARQRPTALLAADFNLFHQNESILHRHNIRIPGDLSVIAFGSAYTRSKLYPPPDLMERNLALIGKTAAAALIGIIDNHPVERTILLPIDYLKRGTIRKIRTRKPA